MLHELPNAWMYSDNQAFAIKGLKCTKRYKLVLMMKCFSYQ